MSRPPLLPCGTRAAYARGCRCDACRTANINYHRRWRGNQPHHLEDLNGPPPPGNWLNRAACRGLDTNLFFPRRGEHAETARTVCVTCPVKIDCLTWAVQHNEHLGFYGGVSPAERESLRA